MITMTVQLALPQLQQILPSSLLGFIVLLKVLLLVLWQTEHKEDKKEDIKTNDKRDDEIHPPEVAPQHEHIFDFLTAASEKYLQTERECINEITPPSEFEFENIWKFCDGTVLDNETVPSLQK